MRNHKHKGFRRTRLPRRKTQSIRLMTDGASRGNPGPAAIGVLLLDGSSKQRISRPIGTATNNVAEWQAVVAGLEEAAKRDGWLDVQLFTDSELVVKQFNGEYAVRKPDFIPLYQKAMRLISGFGSFHATHIPREHNTEADALAHAALNGQRKVDASQNTDNTEKANHQRLPKKERRRLARRRKRDRENYYAITGK